VKLESNLIVFPIDNLDFVRGKS